MSAADSGNSVPDVAIPGRPSFERLRDVILGQAHRPFVYVPNTGNVGDSLIAEATYQFLDRIGISYRLASLEDIGFDDACVLLGGGGNLVEPYPNMARFLDRNVQRLGHLVLLPHSVRSYADKLRSFEGRADIFCREDGSLAYCRAELPTLNIHAGHDMAFFWQRRVTAEAAALARRRIISRPKLLLRELKQSYRLRQISSSGKDGSTLNAFREDVESVRSSIPEANFDLSSLFATDSMDRSFAATAVDNLCRCIEGFDTVRTDRLHIAIAATLLGRNVEMHDNNYGKNSGVYDRSMAGRFDNVRFNGPEALEG